MSLFGPSAVGNDISNSLLNNAIFSGEFMLEDATRRVSATDFVDLLLGQFCAARPFAMRVSALLVHIARVVLLRTKKQMSRINASAVVTMVTHMQAIGNWAISEFIRHAVRGVHSVSTQANFSVSMMVMCCRPLPTFIRAALVYLFPKAFRQWAFWIGAMTFYVLRLVAIFVRGRSGQAATTSTEYGMIEGHQKHPFWCLIRERFAVAARSFYWLYRCNYSTERSNEERRT